MLPELFTRKLSGRSKVQLGAAVACAAISFLLVQGYTARVRALDPGELVEVVTVSRSIPRGSLLGRDDLAMLPKPSNFTPPDAITSVDEAVGQVLRADLVEGEVLTQTRLASGAGPVAALVPDGLSAIVVTTGLPEGLLIPGDRIDLVATYGGGQPWSETVATQIEVLDVLPTASGTITEGTGGVQLVLLVDDTSAQEIAHAKAFAQIEAIVLGAAGATPSQEASPGLG